MSIRRCLFAFGANLGSREAMWDAARRELAAAGLQIEAVSRLHFTTASGGPAGQPSYVNAALTARSSLEPLAILALLREVEAGLGRTRKERWEPRTIDLDLLLVDDLVCELEGLTLPHPRMAWRRFVLEPAAEIASGWRHPVLNVTVGDLARCLRERPPLIAWLNRQHKPGSVHETTLAALDLRVTEPGEWTAEDPESGWAKNRGWTVVASPDPGELEPIANHARLVVWDHREWAVDGKAGILHDYGGCAVMDLARESGSACDDLAAAIQAMC